MFSDRADEARERFEECRREAARATNAVDVVAWLSLADEWRKLAQATDIDLKVLAAASATQKERPVAAAS